MEAGHAPDLSWTARKRPFGSNGNSSERLYLPTLPIPHGKACVTKLCPHKSAIKEWPLPSRGETISSRMCDDNGEDQIKRHKDRHSRMTLVLGYLRFRHRLLRPACPAVCRPGIRRPNRHSGSDAALDGHDVDSRFLPGGLWPLAGLRLLHLPGDNFCGGMRLGLGSL